MAPDHGKIRPKRRRPRRAKPLEEVPAPRQMERLWRLYARHRATRTRNRLVLFYRRVAHRLVGRVLERLPSQADRHEMLSAVDVALLRLVEQFDPGRGTPFDAFMQARLLGAILDVAREADFVSRTGRHAAKRHAERTGQLQHRLGRRATTDEVERECGPPPPTVALQSLDAPADGGQLPVDAIPERRPPRPNDPFWKYVLKRLNFDEALVLALHFRFDITQAGIARILGMAQTNVSRMIASAIRQIRREARDPAFQEGALEHFGCRPAARLADG